MSRSKMRAARYEHSKAWMDHENWFGEDTYTRDLTGDVRGEYLNGKVYTKRGKTLAKYKKGCNNPKMKSAMMLDAMEDPRAEKARYCKHGISTSKWSW